MGLDLYEYLRYKMRRLDHDTARQGTSVRDRCVLLSKILADPVHVARRMLQYRGALPPNDGRVAVIRADCSTFPGSLCGLLNEVCEADEEYTTCLAEQARSPDEPMYQSVLQKIEGLSTVTYEFVRGNALIVNVLPTG